MSTTVKKMYCPKCHSPMEKARLDVYWCKYCSTSWLVHKLSYKSLEEASKLSDDEYMNARAIRERIIERDRELLEKLNDGSKKIRVPPKQ